MKNFSCDVKIMLMTAIVLVLFGICQLSGCGSPTEDNGGGGPQLTVDTSELSFGESLSEITFSISNNGEDGLEWTVFVANDAPWCQVTPDNGTDETSITVKIDRSLLLKPGNYSTVLTVNSNGGRKEINVRAVSSTGTIIIDTPLPE
ncbi:MAG: BACON domain-containing protein [Candidatus Latescibacteria bacterium]|nr:BACON domain-containing protein [Candidatus Latescibacterota bacterium]